MNKRSILVTGGEGFIGSALCRRLKGQGHRVSSFDVSRSQSILNLEQLSRSISESDIVLHLAAQADLTKMAASIEEGLRSTQLNVDGTNNVCAMCAMHQKWLIFASTICVYGNSHDQGPKPTELYACSKLAAEWIVQGYGSNYNMPWTILRFATTYGPSMRDALGVSRFIKQATTGLPVTVHGDGTQNRTLTHVSDLVEGTASLIGDPEIEIRAKSKILNVSSPEKVTAIQMARDIVDLAGKRGFPETTITHIEQRPNQVYDETIDVSGIQQVSGWEAKIKWQNGIETVFDEILESSESSTRDRC